MEDRWREAIVASKIFEYFLLQQIIYILKKN